MNKKITFSLTFLFLFSGSVYGDDYQDGYDAYLKQDYKTAHKLWLPLAKQGNGLAAYHFGEMYEQGHGVTQDYQESYKWYLISAGYGYAKGQHFMGKMSYMEQDYKDAIDWLRLAAEQELAEAQYDLGVMYHKGEGVTQDHKEAVKWYRLAGKQGYALAQSNLGVMYFTGNGVPQDYVLAHMWFNLSGSNGYQEAKSKRKTLEKGMTPSQIEKAQEMARNWKPKK